MSDRHVAIFSALTLLGSLAFVSPAQAGEPICKPTLGFREVRFSPMQPPTLERKWTAALSVDASRCATASGRFGIIFSRMKENAPEAEFIEHFTWKPGSMEVTVNFWADEAVEGYWLNDVAACPCRD
jgi:hypothetical protein